MSFSRVRMATQSRIAECTDKAAAKESEHARKLIRQIGKLNARYVEDYEKTVTSVTEALRQENIYLVNDAEVTPEQLAFIQKFLSGKTERFVCTRMVLCREIAGQRNR